MINIKLRFLPQIFQFTKSKSQLKTVDDGCNSEEQYLNVLAVFHIFDLQKNGKITAFDLQQVFRVMGENLSIQEIAEMMIDYGEGKGYLTFETFCSLMREKYQYKELQQVFQHFDTKKQGKLSLDDLQIAMKKLGMNVKRTDAETLILLADSDGDGKLNFDEFIQLLKLCNVI